MASIQILRRISPTTERMAAATSPRFNDLVANAITAQAKVPAEQIIILDNSDKYAPDGIKSQQPAAGNDSLYQIFGTMANMNHSALQNDMSCAGSHGPSFRAVLLDAATQLARLANGRRVRYVELGPEPWKSSTIITHLLAAGVQLTHYVGIDINPESLSTMRDALVPIIGAGRFGYLTADFYKCSADDIPGPPSSVGPDVDYITIVTNLGFQEGNDLPGNIGPMLTRLTRPGDLLVSEMQVWVTSSAETAESFIRGFYDHPEMRRQSGLVGRQFDPTCSLVPGEGDETEYVIHLVPVQTEVGVVKVAATPYLGAHRRREAYTTDQFNLARETTGKFAVRKVLETGDKSVIFQIAGRV
ncbi:MFS transporter [Mycena venus]|uniref:MFS transporter n=1 Tax=Mycena venus TaxID=2733690 RepID=A0A8H6Z0B5_9AGAR|nr:MFS transporter [Mycena venus]